MKPIFKFALGYFIFSLIMQLIGKFAIPIESVFSFKYIGVQMLIAIILTVVLGRKFFRSKDYALTYGEALKNIFLGCFIATVLSIFVGILLYMNDTEAQETFIQAQIDSSISGTTWGMEFAGAPEEKIEDMRQEIQDKYDSGELAKPDFPMSFKALPMTLLTSVFMLLIYALIASIFVKEKQQV